MVSRDESERVMKSTMAREHVLIAIDHLFRARQLAFEATPRIKLVNADGGKTQNDIIREMSEDTWKGLVSVFLSSGIINPGDIGRYGIPAADRRDPASPPPSGNGQHAVDLSSPRTTYGEDSEEAEPEAGEEETSIDHSDYDEEHLKGVQGGEDWKKQNRPEEGGSTEEAEG